MKKPNLASELREHRERQNLTTKQQADNFHVPEKEYETMESGKTNNGPDKEKKYRNLLAKSKLGSPKPREWYQSGAWHWVIPIAICAALIFFATGSSAFHNGMGLKEGESIPLKGVIIGSLVFCGTYWYIWTPQMPFKKSGEKKNV